MLRSERLCGAALAFTAAIALGAPGLARAEDEDEGELRRHFDHVRLAAHASSFAGTALVGNGSVGRYRHAGGALGLQAERLVRDGVGFGVSFLLFTLFEGGAREVFFARGELTLEASLLTFEGRIPGSVVVGAGAGGDGGRYWFAEDGRFYPLAFARMRLWPTRRQMLQARYDLIPVAVASAGASLHEHRLELATGWGMLQFGTTISYVFSRAGSPERSFAQQELGFFVGIAGY